MRARRVGAIVATLVIVCSAPWARSAAQGTHDHGAWLDRCREWGDSDRPRYCEVRESAMRPTGGTLEIDGGENGGALLTGWDRDSIAVFARIQTQASSDDDARALARQVRVVSENGSLHAEGPSTHRQESWSVVFEVYVPKRTDLHIETHNGPVSVERVQGKMDLRTINGPLVLTDVAGDVRGRAENGPVNVELTGSRWEGAGLDAETVNGPVTLQVPERYSAHLETGTTNGPMSVGFPITVVGRLSHHLSVDLGDGGPTVRAVTTNGPVRLERGG